MENACCSKEIQHQSKEWQLWLRRFLQTPKWCHYALPALFWCSHWTWCCPSAWRGRWPCRARRRCGRCWGGWVGRRLVARPLCTWGMGGLNWKCIFLGVNIIKIYDFILFFTFSTFICSPRDENSQGQPYKIIKHFFGASLVILVSHHNAGFFTVFSS